MSALKRQNCKLFHDGDSCHIETSLLICWVNQWTGLYMIGSFVVKELEWRYLRDKSPSSSKVRNDKCIWEIHLTTLILYKGKLSQKSTNGKKLNSITRFRADDKLRKMYFLKNNNLTLKTRRAKSIVKEVMNHASCFSNYTVITAQEWRFSYGKNCSIFDKTFHAVKELLYRCVKSVRIRSYSGPHFPAFGMNTERQRLSFRIQFECGKMRTRITPNMDTFYAMNIINDTHTEQELVLCWIQYKIHWNTRLAASDVFICLHNQLSYLIPLWYRCLKNVVHQIGSKNEWLLLSVTFTAKLELVFILTLENHFS